MNGDQITVILNCYNRGYTLERQLEALKNQTVKVPDENIWIWYNKGKNPQPLPKNSNHRTFTCNENTKFHGRFAAAMLVRTTYVAFLDDDIIPGPRWFESCLANIQHGILGGSGVTIYSKGYQHHVKHGWNGNIKPMVTTRVDLIGHAWFLKKEWLKYMWYEEPFSWENGEDIMLCYLCQKYGGINTFVPPHPEHDKSVWSNVEGGKIGSDENASFIINKDHYPLRDMVCSKAIDGGWKTVNNVPK